MGFSLTAAGILRMMPDRGAFRETAQQRGEQHVPE
jgi:hypothetical protein